MADPLLKATQRKRAALEGKLNSNPDFVLWKALKDAEDALRAAAAAAEQTVKPKAPPISPTPISKPVSKAAPIIAEAVQYLREQKRRMTSTEMAPALLRRGVKLDGGSPAATLSAYLSAAKDVIDNVRGEGYGLKEWSIMDVSESKAPDSSELSDVSDHHGVVN